MNNYFLLVLLTVLSSFSTSSSDDKLLAEKWANSIRLSIEEQQKHKILSSDTKSELNLASQAWACRDTVSANYKKIIGIRHAFIKYALHEYIEKISDVIVIEFPRSGEIASNDFFLIYRQKSKFIIRKYTFNEQTWHYASTEDLFNFRAHQLFTEKRCYKHGANTNTMSVINFKNHGNIVSAQYYPPYSCCGTLNFLYSM